MNPNMFISTTRLSFHNLPLEVTDAQLHATLLKQMKDKNVKITEVICDKKYISIVLLLDTGTNVANRCMSTRYVYFASMYMLLKVDMVRFGWLLPSVVSCATWID